MKGRYEFKVKENKSMENKYPNITEILPKPNNYVSCIADQIAKAVYNEEIKETPLTNEQCYDIQIVIEDYLKRLMTNAPKTKKINGFWVK